MAIWCSQDDFTVAIFFIWLSDRCLGGHLITRSVHGMARTMMLAMILLVQQDAGAQQAAVLCRESGEGIQMPTGLFPKILVPVDFSSCSEEAFRVAVTLARVFQSEVLLMHVIDTTSLDTLNSLGLALPVEEAGQRKRLSHRARLNTRRLLQSDEAKGLTIRRIIAEGSPFVEIARTARTENVSLVVMGSFGGHTDNVEKMFFGTTAEKVVRTAACPILTVPLPGKPMSRGSSKTASR